MGSLLDCLIKLLIIEPPRYRQKGQNRIAGSLTGRGWRNAVVLVVGVLNGPAPLGFRDRLGHRIGEVVGIQQRHAFDMAGGPTNGLNQRTLGPQKALLVRIKNGHQRNLRQVQALPQQVHPHQHVVFAIAQILENLDPLD